MFILTRQLGQPCDQEASQWINLDHVKVIRADIEGGATVDFVMTDGNIITVPDSIEEIEECLQLVGVIG